MLSREEDEGERGGIYKTIYKTIYKRGYIRPSKIDNTNTIPNKSTITNTNTKEHEKKRGQIRPPNINKTLQGGINIRFKFKLREMTYESIGY